MAGIRHVDTVHQPPSHDADDDCETGTHGASDVEERVGPRVTITQL